MLIWYVRYADITSVVDIDIEILSIRMSGLFICGVVFGNFYCGVIVTHQSWGDGFIGHVEIKFF